MTLPANIHATAVVLGERGILISGRSGAGKTGLALALLTYGRSVGVFSRLVGDDQLLLEAFQGRLVCSVPRAIAGLVEVRGLGPSPVAFEARICIDLIVRLAPQAEAPRYPEGETELLEGCELASITLPEGDRLASALAVAARLSMPLFA